MNSRVPKQKPISDGALFHERLAKNWTDGYSKGGFRRRIFFFKNRMRECVRRNDRWLDAGCGSGVLSRELGNFGAEVVAVDGSPSMIQSAIKETDLSHGRIFYKVITTIESLGEPDLCFDGVLCSSVIEYVDHPGRSFAELFRVTKSGGIILLSVPNSYSLIRLMQKIIRKFGKFFGKDYYPYLAVSKCEFSARAIRNSLKRVGFIVDQIDYFDPFFSILCHFRLGSLLLITAHKK